VTRGREIRLTMSYCGTGGWATLEKESRRMKEKTEKNLASAFAAESKASVRNEVFSRYAGMSVRKRPLQTARSAGP